MGDQEYIAQLEHEASDRQERINKAVRQLDELLVLVDISDPAYHLAKNIQSQLRGK